MRLSIAAALTLLASPAAAAPSTVWQELEAGPTRQQVQALYPGGQVRLAPDCSARILAQYDGDQLRSVLIRFGSLVGGGGAWEQTYRCQKIVRATMIARYGQPVGAAFQKKTLGFGTVRWTHGPVTIEYYAAEDKPFTVIAYHYAPAGDGGFDIGDSDQGALPLTFPVE